MIPIKTITKIIPSIRMPSRVKPLFPTWNILKSYRMRLAGCIKSRFWLVSFSRVMCTDVLMKAFRCPSFRMRSADSCTKKWVPFHELKNRIRTIRNWQKPVAIWKATCLLDGHRGRVSLKCWVRNRLIHKGAASNFETAFYTFENHKRRPSQSLKSRRLWFSKV